MNLTVFAPNDFKEHLKVLENKAKFNSARLRCELGGSSNYQHYVLTGNEGVGKSDAVQEIIKRISGSSKSINYTTRDAIAMFDANDGFGSSMAEALSIDTVLHITNADRLGMRGNTNPNTGMEELCNCISNMRNIIVVLSGKRNRLMELVKGHEKAKEWFP